MTSSARDTGLMSWRWKLTVARGSRAVSDRDMPATVRVGFVLLLAVAFHAPPASALSCEELTVLLDARTPLPIVAETIRAASLQPTRADMDCLRARGVDPATVRLLSDAAGLRAGEDAAASEPPAGLTATDPPAGVSGMDAVHSQKASAAGPLFRQRITTYRRDVCSSLERSQFVVDVAYSSEARRTTVVVAIAGLAAMPVRPHPGGRMMAVGCTSIVAAAGCFAWDVSQLLIRHELPGDDLVYAYDCGPSGAEPVALRVATAGRLHPVPIYRPSASVVLLASPRALPDGTPNGTARLIETVGEAGLP